MFEKTVRQQLLDLQNWQLVAFGLALSERMLPNFVLFANLLEFGNTVHLRQILDVLWDKLANKKLTMNLDAQLDKVEANIPDPAKFSMYGALPARDVILAIYATLNIALEADAVEADGIANLSRASVASFIEFNEADAGLTDEALQSFINSHDLMVQEDAFQAAVLACITSASKPNKTLLTQLRTLASNEGISNIGISE